MTDTHPKIHVERATGKQHHETPEPLSDDAPSAGATLVAALLLLGFALAIIVPLFYLFAR